MKISYSPIQYDNNNYSFGQSLTTHRKMQARAALLGLVGLLGMSCAPLRGGNYIYDEASERIESFADYKKENNLIGKDVFYNADTLQTEDIKLASAPNIGHQNEQYLIKSFQEKGIEPKANIFSLNYLKTLNLDDWIKQNKEQLIGSCCFTKKGNDLFADIIANFTTGSSLPNEFIPAHIGSIFEKNGELRVLNIVAPKASTISLKEYISNYKGKFLLYLRDYKINTDEFSKQMQKYEGMEYSYLSAIQTLFRNFNIKEGIHCSEAQVLAMQRQGLLKGVDANKITPTTLLRVLMNEKFIVK